MALEGSGGFADLSQLLAAATAGTASTGTSTSTGIDIHSHGNLDEIHHLSYADLFHAALRNGDIIRPAMTERRPDAVVLLHLNSRMDGIVWFWSVVLAGYTPTLSPSFVRNVD
jgi:hypothetical protein